MVKGGEIGGFGGGSLEHPRQRLGAKWVGLCLECRAAWSRQARPGEALEPSWGTAKRASLTVLQFCEAMPVWDVGMADAIVRVKVAPACEHEVEPAITASSLGSPGI